MLWLNLTFDQLTTHQLYDLLKLRCDVFVVEQECFYPDLDDKDRAPHTRHILAYEHNQLVAYTRLLAPGVSYPTLSSIGRVVTASNQRGKGTGHTLMEKSLATIDQLWPDTSCHISAQAHLQPYYKKHAFVTVGEGYLEDNIPHIGMERPAANEK